MSGQFNQIMAFFAVRYYQDLAARPILAQAYLAIINQARALQLSSPDPERDLLAFLSKPPTDPDLARARKEVLEHIGSAP
jgi:hypothetical protein